MKAKNTATGLLLLLVLVGREFYFHNTMSNTNANSLLLRDPSNELSRIETITIDMGSCVIGEILQPGGPYTCHRSNQPEEKQNPEVLHVVFDNKTAHGGKPDARMFYASNIDIPFPQRPQACKKITEMQPQPWESHSINVLWSWESTQHDQFEHNSVNMSQYSFFLGFNPIPSSTHIFSNLGFDHLRHRLRQPIVSPEKRMTAKDGGGLVVWAATNCASVSRRLEYLKKLNDVAPVHSIGKCWNNMRGKSANNSLLPNRGRGLLKDGFGKDAQSEWIHMGTNYKFYFAAENYLCDGYVSEKMWIGFAYGMVPILYGTSVHASFAPSIDSYIDVRNFTSSKELGQFLLRLDEDDDAYMQYHAWRNRSEEQWNPNFVSLLQKERHWHVSNPKTKNDWETQRKGWHNRKSGVENWVCKVAAAISWQKRQIQLGSKLDMLTLQPFKKCPDPQGTSIPM